MTRGTSGSGPVFPRVCAVLVLHFFALVGIRLVYEADEYNNWDLISLLNATAFPSLRELLALPEVHFRQPFSFPAYNTGAESVASLLIHRLVGSFSLYWSNAVVLLVYDVVFLVALHRVFRLVFREAFLECTAWTLVAMSPILLTFMSISAFDTQAFATLVLALLGSEYVLQSRPLTGVALMVFAFACISQAYGLTFFLPVFCVVWAGARSMHYVAESSPEALRPGSCFLRNLLLLIATIGVCTMGVEYASHGQYWRRAFTVISGPYLDDVAAVGPTDLPGRIGVLLHAAFTPTRIAGKVYPGFAPYVMLLALGMLLLAPLAFYRRLRHRPSAPTATETHGMTLLAAAAWLGLVLFGYVPGMSGGTVKSQRCVFGDIFLVMAVVALVRSLISRAIVGRRTVLVQLLVLLCVSDVYYLSSVARFDHARNHFPLFDYDTRDSVVRHDLISVIELMRAQATNENAGLVIYYPRGRNENRTDPALFFGRFLRHFGRYRDRDDLVFACRFCDVPYGCPFPEVRKKPCHGQCCYEDPFEQIATRPSLQGRKLYLWWYDDAAVADGSRRADVLNAFGRHYRVVEVSPMVPLQRWTCYELTPAPGNVERSSGDVSS